MLFRSGLTARELETFLSETLSRGGDYADLYFEQRVNHSIVLEEGIIKSAMKGVHVGVGIRVLCGEKTGYAYCDDLNRENIFKAARTAAFIANASNRTQKVEIPSPAKLDHSLYAIPLQPADLEIVAKIDLLKQADASARAYEIGRAHV